MAGGILILEAERIRVAVNGYGVIGKRVADAVGRQWDMSLAGVCDVVTDWRARMVSRHGFGLFGATGAHADRMRAVGLDVAGTLDDLLAQADVVVDDRGRPHDIKTSSLTQMSTPAEGRGRRLA